MLQLERSSKNVFWAQLSCVAATAGHVLHSRCSAWMLLRVHNELEERRWECVRVAQSAATSGRVSGEVSGGGGGGLAARAAEATDAPIAHSNSSCNQTN